MTDLILAGGTVITMDPDRRIIERGAVAVAGDRILQVGESAVVEAAHPGARRIDCTGRLVLPGLIDAHGHAGHSLIKTLAADIPALWMRVVTPTYFHSTTREFWLADGYVSALDRLRAGVTTGVSVMASCPRSDDPQFSIDHARAYAEVGLREIVCTGPAGLPWPHPATRWDGGRPQLRHSTLDEMLAGAEAVIESVDRSADGRILVYLTPFTIVPSVDPSNPSTPEFATALTDDDRLHARRVRETARKHGVRIHSDAFGGMVRMAAQDRENAILGPDVHLQHCIGLSLEEVEILAETGTRVSHAPGGRAPILPMMTRGVPVAITTDGTAPQSSFDLLQAARQVQFAHRLVENDDYLLPAGRLLEMITIDAAKVLGLDDSIGSLEPGKKADVIVVDGRQPHMVPAWMPVHRLIHGASGQDVETVLVDGRIVMEGRSVKTVDMAAALENGEREARLLVARAGLEDYLAGPGWGRIRTAFDRPVRLPDWPGR
jgi:cytosine/adenosine deaminase-related metal-dependent hydrolase